LQALRRRGGGKPDDAGQLDRRRAVRDDDRDGAPLPNRRAACRFCPTTTPRGWAAASFTTVDWSLSCRNWNRAAGSCRPTTFGTVDFAPTAAGAGWEPELWFRTERK
jgi:hypothetical protein